MNILHVCSDYAGTPLYKDLVESIDRKGIKQLIYVPVRSADLINKYKSENLTAGEYYYSYILNPYLRVNYYRKINKIYNDVRHRVHGDSPYLTHAHFLFSDGGVAYRLHKKEGIPYIVAVRNTDIFVFFRYLIHLRSFGIKILQNAERIVFLSPSYKKHLLDRYIPAKYRKTIEDKSVIIPNGINDFWLQNMSAPRRLNKAEPHIIYVGEFSRNKNIPGIIETVDKLRLNGINARLTLVGEYGDDVNRIRKLVLNRKEYIESYPRITDKKMLLERYREADVFVMPSFFETFGLVYLEAMSQGLPLIYSKDQGFDGFYTDGRIGYAVNPSDTDGIADKISSIFGNYETISMNCIEEVHGFSWDAIVSAYMGIYSGTSLTGPEI